MSENKAITYDDKFIDPPKSNTGKIDKYLEKNNDVVTQQFDLSKNMDYLQGWENPLTYQGGNNVTNIQDPFEELRAQRQPGLSKFFSLTGRVSTKVLGEIAKMPAYIGGLVGGVAGEISDAYTNKNEYSFTEQAFNNGWIRAVENLNQNINQDLLPVYVKKSVQEGNLWDNISSVDFWATEGADGIGFMVSMMVPGAVLKSLGLGTKMMNFGSRIASLGNKSQKLAKVVRGVEKLGLNAQKLDVFNATVANTYLEAAAESGMAMDSFEKEHKEKFIQNELALGKTMEEAEDSFNTQKAILGRDMFTANAMLLLGPNAIQSSMMFGKGTSKLLSSYSLKDASKSALKRVAKNTFSEGFVEEAGQSAVESYFKNKASKGQLKGDGFMSLEDFDPKGLKDAYLNTISSVDGQKAIFLGAVLGSTTSVYQGRTEDISNKKATEKSKTLTTRYDDTLRALIETDVYKRDSEGNIEYDMNNNPIVNKSAIIEKFKTIDSLSHRFEEYDKALQSGDAETLEKARNKTIQDVILPFVKEGEIGIESLSKYYDTMLESEEIQSSESFEEVKARKEEVLKIAKDVSKKYENYSQFALGKFNIDIPTENKEQLQILNNLKKQYFNKLSSSYAMAEIERKQVESKLQKVNKEISYLEDINKIGEVTTEEAINADWSKDVNKEIPNNKRNELASKNEAYRDLLDHKKRLEDKFNEVEKEIADNYFDNKKIKEDFIRQNSETVKTEEVENESTEDVDDFIDPNDFGLGDHVDDNQTPSADTTTPTQSSTNTPTSVNNQVTTQPKKTKPVKKPVDPRVKELEKKIFLLENVNKPVVINGSIKGTLVKVNDERYEIHDDNYIHEINIDDIQSFKADSLSSKYEITNLTEESVTVNGVDYIINLGKNNKIESLSPVNKPSQEIKNEKLLIAVEIKRNQSDYKAEVENSDEIIEKLENNYPNISAILDTIWETNMTETIAEALDNLYEDKKLTKSQELQLSLWLIDAFKRVNRLYSEKNTKEENETLNQAYSNLENIEALLYNLNINKNETKQEEKSSGQNEVNVVTTKAKNKTTERNEEVEALKKEKEELLQKIKDENTKFEEPVLTEEEKIDKALEVNETDEIIKEIQSKIKDQEILTKEQLDSEINELYVDDELKEAISLILTDERDSLEDQESFDNKNKAALSELEGIDEEEMKVSDVSEDVPLDESYNEDVTVEDISINENSKIKGHLLMSLNKLFQPIFDNLKDFINYEKEPRNKINDDVSFSFGDLSNIKEPTIKAILDKVKSGKKLIKSELDFLKNNQEYLENNLPIEVTISNGKKSAKTFLTALGSRTGVSKDIFIKEELPLRKSIIKKLIDNNFDFSKFKGSVKYQGKGKLNLDNFNTNNNVLDLSIFKNMSDKEKVKYFQDNTFYVNTNRELVNSKTKQPTTESFNHTLKGLYPGDVFLITTRPNGEKFPLKLNNNRLSREKANSVVKVLSLWSNLVKNNLNINGTLESFLNDNLGSDIEYLKSELELVKDLQLSNIQKLETLINYVINSQNNNEVSKFYLDNKGNLILGSLLQKVNEDLKDQGAITYESRLDSIGFVGFNYTTLEELYKDDLDTNQESVKEHLINFLMYKKFSIKNEFANSKYVEHVLGLNNNESLVSTNVDVNKDMFEGYSNIFLNNEVVDIEENSIKNEDKQIEKTVIPTQSFQGYPAPTPTNENTSNKAEDLVRQMINGKQIIEFTVDEQNLIDTIPVSRKIEIQSEIENNTENIRNSQENSVSLPDSTKEVVDNSINTNNLTDSQKKEFNKVALKLVDKSVVQEALKLKSIDDIFNKLKSELTNSDLNETLNTVCKK